MTTTLLEMRTAARLRADMASGSFVTDTELNRYINRAAAELYDLLVTVYEDYYTTSVTSAAPVSRTIDLTRLTTFGGGSGTEARAYKIRKLEWQDGGYWIDVHAVPFAEKNRFNRSPLYNGITGKERRWSTLIGNTIYLWPETASALTYRLWFIPAWVDLVSDTDTFDNLQNWQEYVEIKAAMQCLAKEESDVSELAMELGALRQRIEDSAPARDAGEPMTIADVQSDPNSWWWSQ